MSGSPTLSRDGLPPLGRRERADDRPLTDHPEPVEGPTLFAQWRALLATYRAETGHDAMYHCVAVACIAVALLDVAAMIAIVSK